MHAGGAHARPPGGDPPELLGGAVDLPSVALSSARPLATVCNGSGTALIALSVWLS